MIYIHAIINDIQNPLPFDNSCIDICLIPTVLHSLDLNQTGPLLFRKIKRVLEPGGRLAIIECNKENQAFGLPVHMRISANELNQYIPAYSFISVFHADFGFNYMSTFVAQS